MPVHLKPWHFIGGIDEKRPVEIPELGPEFQPGAIVDFLQYFELGEKEGYLDSCRFRGI